MHRILGSTIAAALLAAAALQATPALAQRVFVAAQGSDANPCTFALPCRTFQHAHDTVAAGGEIDVLDPAGYGVLNITKSISIQGHGFSGISVTGGVAGISITASSTDTVNLNGLLIEGGGVGSFGIIVNSAKSLVVENCVVHNVTTVGLTFASAATTLQTLSVSDSHFSDIAGSAILIMTSSSGPIAAAIERTGLVGNAFGLNVNGTGGTGAISVAATASVASNNASGGTGGGFVVSSSAGHSPASLALTRVTAAGNQNGIEAIGTNATVRLGQSTVTGNITGYNAASSGVIFSYGDNYIDGNNTTSGSLTAATKQ
jgi:hypothetical protein